MPLGYKYVERDATDYVNWAEIGKNMSDMFENERKIREQKKAAIDEDSRQIGITLSKYPQGQDTNARTAALKLADDATQYKNLQLKLLKSGKLKLKDYLINTQNLKDSINQSFDALESYQKGYGESMDAYRNGTASIMQVDNWKKLEEIGGDWGGVQFVINPTNGVLNLAKTKKKIIDGKEVMSISDDPNDIYSMNQIMGITKSKIDKFDAQKTSNDWASQMATYIKSDAAMSAAAGLWKQGKVVTIDDITRRADELKLSNGERQEIFNFYNAENQWIDSSLSNPYARGSVLMDHLQFVPGTNKMYRRTHDKADAAANEEAIYEEINPSTQQGTLIFSDKQKKDSNDFMRNMTRPKYKYEEKVQTTGQLQDQTAEWKTKRADEKKAADTAMNAWNQVFTARTPEAKRVAVDNLLGTQRALSLGMTGIDVGDGTVTISYEDRDPRTIKFDKTKTTLGQWAELGTEIHGVDDTKQVMKRSGGGNPNALMTAEQQKFIGVTASRTPQDYGKKIGQDALNKITDQTIVKNDASATAENLNTMFSNLGYTFTGDYSLGMGGKTDYIQISTGQVDKAGEPILSEKITIDDKDTPDTIKQKIAAYLASNVNKKLAKSVYGELKPGGSGELD